MGLFAFKDIAAPLSWPFCRPIFQMEARSEKSGDHCSLLTVTAALRDGCMLQGSLYEWLFYDQQTGQYEVAEGATGSEVKWHVPDSADSLRYDINMRVQFVDGSHSEELPAQLDMAATPPGPHTWQPIVALSPSGTKFRVVSSTQITVTASVSAPIFNCSDVPDNELVIKPSRQTQVNHNWQFKWKTKKNGNEVTLPLDPEEMSMSTIHIPRDVFAAGSYEFICDVNPEDDPEFKTTRENNICRSSLS